MPPTARTQGIMQALDAPARTGTRAINQVLRPGRPLVLSSRTTEYRTALAPPTGTPVLLNGAAGIRLHPLNAAQAAAYLLRDAGGPHHAAAARWSRVAACLGTGTPAAQALSTPLGLFLARSIYNPRPGHEYTVDLAHPDELLDRTRFPTRQDVDAHLFRIFIPAAYSPHHRQASPWTVKQAEHTLTFLARHLEYSLRGTPNLAWWQLHKALPGFSLALIPGAAVGLVYGTIGLFNSMGDGLVIGILFGILGMTLLMFNPARSPSEGIRWNWKGNLWQRTLMSAVAFGLAFWSFSELIDYAGNTRRVTLAGGLLGLVTGALMGGLTPLQPDLKNAVGPGAVLARDRRAFWTVTLATCTVSCIAIGLISTLSGASLSEAPAIGLTFGIIFGLGASQLGRARSAWLAFLATRIELALLGRVPWRFMAFLTDAHEQRGVLRQVGAVYQFRHLDLQRHLAGPPPRHWIENPPHWPPLTPGTPGGGTP